ncbi:MAG: hypothetical protein LBD28_01000 [Tannerellaceae bacterium]|jgi:hypothetical protein|nr:hypothetical protein [Tannerellaceae bacterium]
MPRFNTPYSPLIEKFDAIGWIPTIKGSLSLNVFDNSNSLLGDVDKFAIEVKTYNGFNTSRYIVASSLFTYDDSKSGSDYAKTFRFIFRGTINDRERQNEFINRSLDFADGSLESTKQWRELFEEKDLCIGKLSIVTIPDHSLTEEEKRLINQLKELKKRKEKYIENHDNKANSLNVLAQGRAQLKTLWEDVESTIIAIENTILPPSAIITRRTKRPEPRPIYKFDVALSRDGVLFLKNDTNICFNFNLDETDIDYNSEIDYKRTIPIHRVFKTSMNYIKFLFHRNYHHHDEHDTFLPASNLHPINHDGKFDRIIKHQMEAFLSPIVKIKRYPNIKKYNLCNPEGVLLYAKSFLMVCKRNEIINAHDFDYYSEFVDCQKTEFDAFAHDRRMIVNFFLSQKNVLAKVTIALTILIAVFQTINFLKWDDILGVMGIKWESLPPAYAIRLLIVAAIPFVAIVIHNLIVRWYTFRGKFNRKKISKNILNQNSNTKKRQLSRLYKIRLLWITHVKHLIREILQAAALTIFIIAVLIFCRWFLLNFMHLHNLIKAFISGA